MLFHSLHGVKYIIPQFLCNARKDVYTSNILDFIVTAGEENRIETIVQHPFARILP